MLLRSSIVFALVFFAASTALGEVRVSSGGGSSSKEPILIGASFDYLLAGSAADTLSGATYSKKYNHPLVGAFSFGTAVWGFVYLGLRYEYWLAQRVFTTAAGEQKDTLDFQTIGIEMGYYLGNQRTVLALLAGVHYPISLRVNTTGVNAGVFEAGLTPYTFQARLMTAIRLSRFHGIFFEAGHRFNNLGKLNSGSAPYIDSGGVKDFDLSGLFFGLGFLVTF